MTSVQDYRVLIGTIKSMAFNNMSKNDKQVLIDLLSTLKYICEFRILRACYDRDEAINAIIPDLDSKLAKLGEVIESLEKKMVEQGYLSEFERIKLKATKVTYNRYAEIKRAISTRNFDHYVKFMNDNITNAAQIMAVCSTALDSANIDYAKTFLINGGEKTSLDIIFDLKRQPVLAQELTKYFNRKKHYTVDNEEKIREDQQFLNYLRLVKDNETVVRGFMDALFTIGTSANDKATVVSERLAKNRLRLSTISDGVLASLRNAREINALTDLITQDEKELKKISKVKEHFGNYLEEMNRIGLGPIASQFLSTSANLDSSVEQRAVEYIKSAMKRRGFDIKDVEQRIDEEVRTLESQIVRKRELLDGGYEALNSYGKELATKYESETEKLLDVVNEKIDANVTPILAAYALKALIDAKSLNFKALSEITHAYDDKGLEALISSYEAIVQNTVLNVQSAIQDVSNRAIYDTTEFGQLKIK